VNVVFFDRRAGVAPTDPTTAVTIARSVDGGQTFVNFAVGVDPFRTDLGAFAGDYLGIAADYGRVVAVFPHFAARRQLVVSAAFFRFRRGTTDVIPDE
jgi:hypothetical protein